MDKRKITSKVKRVDEDKVAVSLRLPKSLKDELQAYSDKEGISMNGLIIETMYSLLDDECGTKLRLSVTYLKNRLNTLLIEQEDIDPDPENIYRFKKITQEINEIRNILS